MLRSEHVIARLSRGRVVPHRLSTRDQRALDAADALAAVYEEHLGGPRSRLEAELAAKEEELGPRLDPRRGFKVVRALAKLLDEKAEWASPTDADPYHLRTRVFELASALPEPPAEEAGLLGAPTRGDVLARVAAETGVADPAAVMFADRRGAEVLASFGRPAPGDQILRYNVAQAQGVLYAARDLVLELWGPADARLVFHYVKDLGLIYNLQPTERGHRLRLDGPLSLFGPTRKYGLRLARLLPALLLTAPWRLAATVEWKGRDALLELDSDTTGMASHYLGPKAERDAGETREAFRRAWERARDTGGWELGEAAGILPFPERREALVPDFTLRHPASGAVAHLEMLGFWSRRNLVERAALLREASRRDERILVAASEKLGSSPETLAEAVEAGVIPFKEKLAVKDVLAKLQGGPSGGGSAG